jgi:hypothetical protein
LDEGMKHTGWLWKQIRTDRTRSTGFRIRPPRLSTTRLVHCELEVPIVHHCLGHEWLGLRDTFSEHERAGATDSLPVSKSKWKKRASAAESCAMYNRYVRFPAEAM